MQRLSGLEVIDVMAAVEDNWDGETGGDDNEEFATVPSVDSEDLDLDSDEDGGYNPPIELTSSNPFNEVKLKPPPEILSEDDKEKIKPFREFIETVISDLTPRYLNLVAEFGDAVPFLIDGDSLLLEIIGDRELAWQQKCAQYLHLVYLVERFLLLFKEKGGKFRLVFFKEFLNLWHEIPSCVLAREALILHFSYNTDISVLTEFSSPYDPKWVTYVKEEAPSFMLLSDAEGYHIRRGDRCLLHSNILACLGLGMSCAFTSALQVTAAKLFGFHVNERNIVSLYKQLKGFLQGQWNSIVKSFSENRPTVPVSLNQVQGDLEMITGKLSGAACNVRTVTAVMVCAYVLKELHTANTDDCSDEEDPVAKQTNLMQDLLKVYLLHLIGLTHLPLSLRAQKFEHSKPRRTAVPHKYAQVYLPFFRKFRYYLATVLSHVDQIMQEQDRVCCSMDLVSDLMDERLFLKILEISVTRSSSGEELTTSWDMQAEQLWHLAISTAGLQASAEMCGFHPVISLQSSEDTEASDAPSDSAPAEPVDTCAGDQQARGLLVTGLLPVSNELIEKFTGDIISSVTVLDASEEEVDKVLARGNDFDEKYHWHSRKPLSDDYQRTKESFSEKLSDDPYKRKWQMRGKQKYMDWMNYYGRSLEGGMLKADVIVVDPPEKQHKQKNVSKNGHEQNKKPKGDQKTGGKGKTKESGKKEKIIQENLKKREDDDTKKEKARWDALSTDFTQNSSKGELSKIKRNIFTFLENGKTPKIRTKALLWLARCYSMELMNKKAESEGSINPSDAVDLVKIIQDLTGDYSEVLSEKNKAQLSKYMNRLGFHDQAKAIHSDVDTIKDIDLNLGMTYARFQLKYMGKYLRRDERTDPDPRVKHFIPDTWQRKLLDVVDNFQSALIVAPTSSGKTYASYYCIERVLKESNDGVVIYVSPTKALVNQVAATVYARFHRKQLPPGRSVFGVFTRDYRHNVLSSQILVTVPQCLEILLLSPKRQEWASRIRYVIFDEVHCLGSEIGAEVWEHVILLIRCPCLALSATVSNPKQLLRWLQKAEDVRYEQDKADNILRGKPSSYKVQLVVHSERHSDLEKYWYDGEKLTPLHPGSMLTYKQMAKKKEILHNIPMTSSETLQLYDIMKNLSVSPQLEMLNPDERFSRLAMRSDARQFEKLVKDELMSLVKDGEKDKVEAVLGKMALETSAVKGKMFDAFIQLLHKLKKEDKLPVIVFSDNRRMCEAIIYQTLMHLEEEEKKLRASPKYSSIINRKRELLRLNYKTYKKDRDKEIRIDPRDIPDREDFSILFEPLPECSFFMKSALSADDKRYIFESRLRFFTPSHPFKRALERGLGFHHAGMDNKRKSAVEMLFRKRHVQVVLATGTLALGINMPCKTVVFAEDSVYLNTLEYQQRSGRAGRRGYDLAGNVIYFGIPRSKVARLLTADLPLLKGNFPLSVTFILRLLLLVSGSDDRQDAMRKALTVLSQPLFSIDNEQCHRQLQIYFLFSVQLLLRQGYIDQHGVPQGLAGLATHLHYHEPANFVLIMLLQKGLFHKLCKRKKGGTFSEDVMKQMVIILANLFGRVQLHSFLENELKSEDSEKPRNSQVVLEDLPKDFAKAVEEYNETVDVVFDTYVRQVSQYVNNKLGQECKLPLSKVDFETEEPEANFFVKKLESSSCFDKVSSIFTALSGERLRNQHGQDDLIHRLRPEVYTDVNAIPKLETKLYNRRGKRIYLNGYAYDFFLHESLTCILRDNGLMDGEAYRKLLDFKLLIDSVSVSLIELGPEKDNVVLAFQQLSREYGEKFANCQR